MTKLPSEEHGSEFANVIDLFSGSPYSANDELRIIRIAPELDGLEMLYSNETHPDSLYSLKILCWALRESGEVVGLVPWLKNIMPCPDINDPLNGRFEGYHDPGTSEVFYEAPIHKAIELETAAEYYDHDCEDESEILQEIPDTIGTHAALSNNGFQSIILTEVVSWRLFRDGSIQGMLIDEEKVESTPVLPGDDCLFEAQEHEDFRYFFQHQIANKIKAEDPEALEVISLLVETSS